MASMNTERVLQQLAAVLAVAATASNDQTTDRMQGHGLRSPHELLAVLAHVAMSLSGFQLLQADDTPAENGRLPDDWNTHAAATGDSWTFRYQRTGQPLGPIYTVKCVCLFDKLLVHVMSPLDKRVYSAEVTVHDHVRPDAQMDGLTWPLSVLPAPSMADGGLGRLFHDSDAVQRYVAVLEQQLIQPLVTTTAAITQSDASAGQDTTSSARMTGFHPDQPGQATGRDSVPASDYRSIGRADLDPLAASPNFIGADGIRFPGQSDGYRDGGGMVVGPEHPMFQPAHHDPLQPDIFGGPQPLPRGSVPPGARFDPIGPFGADPTAPARPGRGRLGPFSGSPDNDELPPPGFNFGGGSGNSFF